VYTSEQLFVAAAANLTQRGQLPDGNNRIDFKRVIKMLWTLFVILLVLWFLGFVTSYTLGGFLHLLLVVAVAVVLIRVIQGRRIA
jgi:hypothetical protein